MRWRGRRLLALGLSGALLAAGGGVIYLDAWRLETAVVASFREGQGHLEHGKALLTQANRSASPAVLAAAHTEFERAAQDFSDGQRIADSSPMARVGVRVPVAGGLVSSELTTVDGVAEMGRRLSRAAQRATEVDSLLMQPKGGGRSSGTKQLLDILDQARPLIEAARLDLRLADAAGRRVNLDLLPASQRPALRGAITTIQGAMAGLDSFDQLLPVLRTLLGADGPRTYLVEQVNPFELRAGGGYIGTYSLLSANEGTLSLLASGDTHELPDYQPSVGERGYVQPPLTLLEFLHDKSWTLGDTNFFPDFPANARAAESFAERDFGRPIDGVIALDLYGVSGLLTVTGPIQVPAYQLTVASDNLLTQMVRLDILDPEHKKILAALAQPLVQQLTTISSDRWPQLIGALNYQASSRHLAMYFNDAQDEAEMARLGMAGGLAFGQSRDFFALVESNYGGNKANYFLTRRLRLELTREGSVLHHVLVEDLGIDLASAPGSYTVPYRAYFRLLVPDDSSARSITPVKSDDHPYTGPPPGTAVIDGWQQLNPDAGSRRGALEIVYRWDTPWSPGADGRHVVYVQKQPGTYQDALSVTWTAAGRSASATSVLDTDREISVGDTGVRMDPGRTAEAQLPRLGI